MDESDVLNLTIESAHSTKFSFGTTVGLRFVEDILRDFMFENFRDFGPLKVLVLAKGEKALEEVLSD